MVDTAPSSTRFTGAKNYFKGAARHADGTWICEKCQYADNATCKNCMFAVWNIDGVIAGFSPDRAYREAHKNDVRDSPMMQKFSMDNVEDRATTNESKRKITIYEKIAEKANEALRAWENAGIIPPSGIRANPEFVRRAMGRSPVEIGSPNLTSLPREPIPYPAMPTRADAGQVIQRLYEVRKNLDH